MSKLVNSIRTAQATVSDAFNQLAEDVESEESSEGDTTPTVEKITITYSDGSTVDFIPSAANEVGPADIAPKSDGAEQAQAQTDSGEVPGNPEQV